MTAWIESLREQALKELPILKLPTAERTPIGKWDFESLKGNNDNAPKIEGIPASVSHLIGDEQDNTIVVSDGQIVFKNLSSDFEDVIIAPIGEAFASHEEVIKPHFNEIAPFYANRLTAVNLLNQNSGLLIFVPRNKVVAEALNVIYLQQDASLVNRNLVITGQSSQLKYIETYVNELEAPAILITEIAVGENSQLEMVSTDRLSAGVTAYSRRQAAVQANGRFSFSHAALSDGNVVTENRASLMGAGASAEVRTVAISEMEQKQNITIKVEHLAPHTTGNIINHGISKDKAALVFNGIGKIHSGMRGSDAQQESRVMMLSETSTALANPFLLIDEYDVTAGHAASVGKIDEDQLYYLMSRGLSRREAETLIIHGFLMPFIEGIENKTTQEALGRVIIDKINP